MRTVAFHYGLTPGLEASSEREMEHFYPPFEFADRLSYVLMPILASISASSSGSSLASLRSDVDMVEFSTGSWDLQHYSFLDRADSKDRFSPLTASRASTYLPRFSRALDAIEAAFPSSGTKKVLREIQHTKLSDAVPAPRARALRDLQKYVLGRGKYGRRIALRTC